MHFGKRVSDLSSIIGHFIHHWLISVIKEYGCEIPSKKKVNKPSIFFKLWIFDGANNKPSVTHLCKSVKLVLNSCGTWSRNGILMIFLKYSSTVSVLDQSLFAIIFIPKNLKGIIHNKNIWKGTSYAQLPIL